MAKQQLMYRAYLVRLWCDDQESGWRGSLEDPGTGDCQYFASVAQLLETIAEQTKLQGATDESAGQKAQ